jgi:hypothetical protein
MELENTMTTLPIRAPLTPTWSFPVFGRFITMATNVLDVFVEAQDQARAAHKRFPFAAW